MSMRLSELTTLGVGGDARRVDFARSRGELIDLSQNGLVIGRGSDILASDDGYDGNIVVNGFEDIRLCGGAVVASSGTRLVALCSFLAENGYTGLEWACGIPGTVGGAVRMNAGAFGGEISDLLVSAEVLLRGEVKTLSAAELGLSYRSSGLGERDVVISAAFAVERAAPAEVKRKCAEYAERRRKSQPRGRSAGSVFKNPRGVSVGKILDGAGLKGLRRGGAMISAEHANIIVNVGGATAKDVTALIEIMRGALEEAGVAAQEEIVYIGGF